MLSKTGLQHPGLCKRRAPPWGGWSLEIPKLFAYFSTTLKHLSAGAAWALERTTVRQTDKDAASPELI